MNSRQVTVVRSRLVRGTCGVLVISLAAIASAQEAAAPDHSQAAAYAESLSVAFRQASTRVLPTVVTIKTAANARSIPGMQGGPNPFQGTPFEDLFDEGMGPRTVPRREGLGSGVIIDPKGVILTNNHVVAESDRVIVELSDGRDFPAVEIQTDPETDLAVVKIDTQGESLPAAVLGDSDKLQIGDWVLAVGSPFGLDATVSAGIISAKGRALRAAERAQFLQTDAAINPGNSGGPLVNLRGEVIGINTAIASRSGAYQGIGFAIPATLAKWVSGQLMRDGRVKRAFLGVGVSEMTADLAEQLGVRVGQGVVVMNVYPNSPADKAGLQLGDIITSFEKTPVKTPGDLQQSVEKLQVGTKVQVTFVRDEQTKVVNIELEELPDLSSEEARVPTSPRRRSEPKTETENAVGVEVQDLNARVARELGYSDRTSGVVVASVDPNALAAEKGIRPGMLITRVGKTDVLTVAQFRQALAQESLEKGILLLVATPSENRFVVLKKY